MHSVTAFWQLFTFSIAGFETQLGRKLRVYTHTHSRWVLTGQDKSCVNKQNLTLSKGHYGVLTFETKTKQANKQQT